MPGSLSVEESKRVLGFGKPPVLDELALRNGSADYKLIITGKP